MENPRNEKLWKMAEQRAKFKRHAANYIAINIFLWLVWYFTGKHNGFVPWPVWVTVGWGFGLFMHFLRAYHTDMDQDTEREYKKLVDRDK